MKINSEKKFKIMKNEKKLYRIIFIIVMVISLIVVINILYNCKKNYISYDEKVMYQIDSVEYHSIGSDNTLQVTPYWKVRLKGSSIFITTYDNKEKGDSISMIKRTFITVK